MKAMFYLGRVVMTQSFRDMVTMAFMSSTYSFDAGHEFDHLAPGVDCRRHINLPSYKRRH